jgi:hypothetical protein
MRVIFNLKLITTMLMVVMVCGACKTKGSGSTPSAGSNSSSASAPFKPSSDARKDLGEALHKLSNAFPYRVTETTTTSAGSQAAGNETTRVLDFAAADRYRVKLSDGKGGDLELITIGDKNYSKEDGKWTEEHNAQKQNQRVDLEKNLADAIKDVTYVGPETVNGVSCFVYNYTIQMAGYAGTGKTYVRASDGLPLQSDSEFKYQNVESKSHVGYEYNADVKVEAPM